MRCWVFLLTNILASGLSMAPGCQAAAPDEAAENSWQISAAEGALAGSPDLRLTTWLTHRPPGKEWDRIRLHRYRSPGLAKATLFYLPGTWMNGVSTEDNERYNLWLFLARRGIEVFTLDYRTHAVAPETRDLSFLRHWDVEVFAEDVKAAAQKVRRLGTGRPLFLAGFSRGVFFAYAYATAEPGGVTGIVALDGYFKHHTPQGKTNLEAGLRQLEDSGEWGLALGRSRGWEARQELMATAARTPGGPPLGEKQPDGVSTVGEQLAAVLFDAWGPGALANPLEGPGQGVSRVQVLARLLYGYDRFYPKVQDLQGRAFGDVKDDPRSSIDDGWGQVKIPVIFFGSTGMGPNFLLHGIASAAECAGPKPEIHVLEGYGHLDILVSEKAQRDIYQPILAWIDSLLGIPRNLRDATEDPSETLRTHSGGTR